MSSFGSVSETVVAQKFGKLTQPLSHGTLVAVLRYAGLTRRCPRPVDRSHGRQFLISSACRARRSGVQPLAMLCLQKFGLLTFDFRRAGRLRAHVTSPANPKIRVLDWTTLDKDEFRGGWRIDIAHPAGKTGTFDVELTTSPR